MDERDTDKDTPHCVFRYRQKILKYDGNESTCFRVIYKKRKDICIGQGGDYCTLDNSRTDHKQIISGRSKPTLEIYQSNTHLKQHRGTVRSTAYNT